MSHHTDLTGVDTLVDALQLELEDVLAELKVRGASFYARGESARNYLRELVVATRRNDPLQRARRQFAGLLGDPGHSALLLAFLQRVQQDALAPPDDRRTLPLPTGVATPVPDYDATPIPGPPVKAIEVDATRPLSPRPVGGPWNVRRKP